MKLSEMLETESWKIPPIGVGSAKRLEDAVQKLMQRFEHEPIETDNLDLVGRLEDFLSRLNHNEWENYPWHEASSLMRDLFCSELLQDKEWRNVSDTLLDSLAISDKKSFLYAAIDIFLINYSNSNKHIQRLAETLSKRDINELPFSRILKENVKIFDRSKAHIQIGELMANSQKPYETLQNNGVTSPHMPGLFEQSFLSMLTSLEQDLEQLKPEAFDKIMNWLAPKSDVIAAPQRARGIEAMLLPFEKQSEATLQETLLRFLVENFRDPRVNKARWNDVSEAALKVLYKWLTTKSLKMFFEIISRYEESHMWERRKQFWTLMNDKGLIDTAWVVLSRQGTQWARQIAKENNDPSFRDHGQISDTAEEKCFFIMKIGNLTIVEGTHSFKLRIFKNGNKNAPNFYKTGTYSYYREDLTVSPELCDESFRHDPQGNWRNRTFKFIERNK
ncbi:EH signature domain-containing protein [Rhodobacteraceae bacterium]|nr:EH signature domain-containing protein [Paracoccaceae bacterium]